MAMSKKLIDFLKSLAEDSEAIEKYEALEPELTSEERSFMRLIFELLSKAADLGAVSTFCAVGILVSDERKDPANIAQAFEVFQKFNIPIGLLMRFVAEQHIGTIIPVPHMGKHKTSEEKQDSEQKFDAPSLNDIENILRKNLGGNVDF